MCVKFLQCRIKAAELLRREDPDKLGSNPQQKQKLKTALALLEKRALDARIRRALPILWAITTASKVFATARRPEAYGVWSLLREKVLAALDSVDFRDTGETSDTLRCRKQKVKEILDHRASQFCTDLVAAASVFDARQLGGVEEPCHFHHCFVAARKLFPMYFQDNDVLQQCQSDLDNYREKKGLFRDLNYPAEDASLQEAPWPNMPHLTVEKSFRQFGLPDSRPL